MKIADIIQSEEDVELAVKMGKWMTEALVAKMTTHLQVGSRQCFGSGSGFR